MLLEWYGSETVPPTVWENNKSVGRCDEKIQKFLISIEKFSIELKPLNRYTVNIKVNGKKWNEKKELLYKNK